jgi:hypothetical protein
MGSPASAAVLDDCAWAETESETIKESISKNLFNETPFVLLYAI